MIGRIPIFLAIIFASLTVMSQTNKPAPGVDLPANILKLKYYR